MNEIGEFFANNYILFIIIAIFSIFALVGYVVENKNGGRRQIMPNNPQNTMSADLEKLKSNLANKSLNSMVSNTMSPSNNSTNNSSTNNFNGIDKL